MAHFNIFYLLVRLIYFLIIKSSARIEQKKIIWEQEKRWRVEGGKFNQDLKPYIENILSLINYDKTQNMNIIDHYNQRIEENEEVDQLPNKYRQGNK